MSLISEIDADVVQGGSVVAGASIVGGAEGQALSVASASYDVTADGGAVGDIEVALGQTLPAGALILSATVNTTVAANSAGLATIALAVGGGVVQAATAYSMAPYTVGVSAASALFLTTSAADSLTVTIGTAALDMGAFSVVITYQA